MIVDNWSGTKVFDTNLSQKFVVLRHPPEGNFYRARKICAACDLELAEIWDEDDLSQMLRIFQKDRNCSHFYNDEN